MSAKILQFGKREMKAIEQTAPMPSMSKSSEALKRALDAMTTNTTWNPNLSFEDEVAVRLWAEGYKIVPHGEEIDEPIES